jgi:hypothetical protein
MTPEKLTAINEYASIAWLFYARQRGYRGKGKKVTVILKERKVDTSRHIFRNRRVGFSGSMDELADGGVCREREVLPQGSQQELSGRTDI